MTTLIVHHPSSARHDTGRGHPERIDRIERVMAALSSGPVVSLKRRNSPTALLAATRGAGGSPANPCFRHRLRGLGSPHAMGCSCVRWAAILRAMLAAAAPHVARLSLCRRLQL